MSAISSPLGQARRRGPLQAGDRVQLTDAKGRQHTIHLKADGFFQSHRGSFAHRELIGQSEGITFTTKEGTQYLVLRPLLSDYTLSMPRGAAVIYPKDAAQIVQMADIFPGARVLEAGVGSGALTISLLSAIGEDGTLLSMERREDFAQIAQANVDLWFGRRHQAWSLELGSFADIADELEPGSVDRIVLDMLSPWENLAAAARALVPGGVLCCYITTVTQMSRLAQELETSKRFTKPQAWETTKRDWHLDGLAVRPQHQMIAHTGFLLVTRTLAPGTLPPRRAKRPANEAQGLGGQWDQVEDWQQLANSGHKKSDRKIRQLGRQLQARVDALVQEPDIEQCSADT